MLQATEAKGLTLLVTENKTGYYGVYDNPSTCNPYLAQVKRGGERVYLGSFTTAEEAALCIARTPEGQAAAAAAAMAPAAAVAPSLKIEEARQQARAEGLTLLKAKNSMGYFGVCHRPDRLKPYDAQVKRSGKSVHLGIFATAEEAALCIARSPEGQAAAAAAAAALFVPPPLTIEEARQQARAEGLTLLKADNKTGPRAPLPRPPLSTCRTFDFSERITDFLTTTAELRLSVSHKLD